MYLGVSVSSKSNMFSDNKSVVDSPSIPTSPLSKKSTLASYHRVREAIAKGYLNSTGKMENPTLQTFSENIGSLQASGLL